MDLAPVLGRPAIEDTPSGLRKITRHRELDPSAPKVATLETQVFIAYGTPDVEFTTALLIDQRVERRTERGAKSTLVQVFQELVDNALTATTEVVETTTFDGRRVTKRLYLCRSEDAEALRPAIGSGTDPIFQVIIDYFGPVAKVTTFDIEITDDGFLYSQSDDTKNNGKLLLRTMRTLASIAPTPAGYTLIGQDEQHIDGYTVYVANFAKGEGEISRDIDYGQSSDQGTTGVTRTTIRHLTAASVLVDPTALVGSVKIGESKNEQDGYRVWTIVYAKGTGEVARETSLRFNDMLTTVTITHLTASSVVVSPITDPLAGGTLIDSGHREADGYRVWTATWRKADITGLIRDDRDEKNNGKLIIYRRSRFNAAPDAPAASIGGTVVEISTGTRQEDGYVVHEATWAEGVGEISRSVRFGQSINEGTIGSTVTSVRYLVAPGGTMLPAAEAGSVLISKDVDEADGYRIWSTVWAKGAGLVLDETDISQANALITYHRVALGAAPSTPTATIGGTVTLFETSVRKADGYEVYDYRWAEGDGQSSITTRALNDGSLLYTVTNFNAAAATPTYPGSGTAYLVELEQTPMRGHFRNQAVYHKPPPTITLKKIVQFKMPGLASFVSDKLTVSPPSERTILCDQEISYGTTQDSTVPFKVDFGAYYQASYIRTNNNDVSESEQKSLAYILASAGSSTGTAGLFNGMLCDEWDAALSSSSPVSRPTGLTTIDVDNSIYLVAIDGTVVYRRVVVTHTF